MSAVVLTKRVHATDPPLWWCAGLFNRARPAAIVGRGHLSRPGGWAAHRCLRCGASLFIGHAPPPLDWREVRDRAYA